MRIAAAGLVTWIVTVALALAGCGSAPAPKTAGQSNTGPTAPPAPTAPAPPAVTPPPTAAASAVKPAVTPAAAPSATPTPPAVATAPPAAPAASPGGPQVKLGDAGKKDFGGPAIVKPITAPVQVLLSVKWRTKDIEVQHALQIYKAEHEHGPKSEKEFFDGVIKANQIDLPKLQPGERYVFDVEQQQLMIEQPGN